MVDVGVLSGAGGVLGGEVDVVAVDQDDGFQDEEAVVFSEQSVEEGACAAGNRGQSRGPPRARQGE